MTPEERFWAKVDKTPGFGPNGDCWKWTGSRNQRGYGLFRLRHGRDPHQTIASRAVLLLSGVDVPAGAVVMHTCDNPSCVRPEHLRVGTQAENLADAGRKGRLNAPKSAVHRSHIAAAITSWHAARRVAQALHTNEKCR